MDPQAAQPAPAPSVVATPPLQTPVSSSPFGRIALYSVLFLAVGFVGGFYTPGLLNPAVVEVATVQTLPQENLNLIERESITINPYVRERLDYYSLYFGFGASTSTQDRLQEIDTVVFNDGNGKELGRVSSKNFSLYLNDSMEDLSLVLPVGVGDYFKENNSRVLEYVFLSKGKVYGRWSGTFGSGYSVNLRTGYCGEKGKMGLCVETTLHPEKCSLFSQTAGNKKIADLKPEKSSGPKIDMTLVPKNEIVYVECYVWFGGSMKSETFDTSTLGTSTQK